jgi:hypothetical protein
MELMRKILNSPLTRRRSQKGSNNGTGTVLESNNNSFGSSGDRGRAASEGNGLGSTLSSSSTSLTIPNGATGSLTAADLLSSRTLSTTIEKQCYFGVALEEIVRREQSDVPRLVMNICQCICRRGLDQEGIFRTSGNARVVERLKTLVNQNGGDVDLEMEDDIVAIAGLLKLFLRELPDSLIPEQMVRQFIEVQSEHANDAELFQMQMKELLSRLPKPNYSTLKYLIAVLVIVAKNESLNKMNALSLGIVFGPNIFRSVSNWQVFRDQGLTNFIVLKFISNYDALFLEPGEARSSSVSFALPNLVKEKVTPHRPPAPKHDDLYSPRRSQGVRRRSIGESSRDELKLTLRSTSAAHFSDDDSIIDTPRRSSSPFHLDSDRSEAGSARAVPYFRPNPQAVDRVIQSVISRHLFADSSSDEQSNAAEKVASPVPLPRRRRPVNNQQANDGNSVAESSGREPALAVASPGGNSVEPNKSKSNGFVRDLVSRVNTGAIADSLGRDISGAVPPSQLVPGNINKSVPGIGSSEEEFVGQLTDTLKQFKRPSGPKNRRPPSMPSTGKPAETINNRPTTKMETLGGKSDGDFHGNSLRHGGDAFGSPVAVAKTPNTASAAVIPPLNLSVFDERKDDSSLQPPVPSVGSTSVVAGLGPEDHRHRGNGSSEADREQPMLVQHRPLPAKRHLVSAQRDEASPSPSALHVTPYLTAHHDTNMPPSPTTHQTYVPSKHSEEEQRRKIKMLTRTIQTCKKKIKAFEENFEKERGYRPSQSNKVSDAEVKQCMVELASARKELHKLKEEAERGSAGSRIHSSNGAGDGGGNQEPAYNSKEDVRQKLEDTCEQLCGQLQQQRRETGRPEDLRLMSQDQIRDEKIAVQKTLLHFEGLYGRPVTKAEKEAMKPLYNRYRQIKQLLAKPQSPRGKIPDLQTVPEGTAMDFTPSRDNMQGSSLREPIRIPSASGFPPDVNDDLSSFYVTRLLPTLDRDSATSQAPPRSLPTLGSTVHAKTKSTDDIGRHDDLSPDPSMMATNLHGLSISQLQSEKEKALADKRRLAKRLRQFEENFLKQNGRKVLKEDRSPMSDDYHQYKQVRAKIKLLEALAAKQLSQP